MTQKCEHCGTDLAYAPQGEYCPNKQCPPYAEAIAEKIGKTDAARCNEGGHKLVTVKCMCGIRANSFEAELAAVTLNLQSVLNREKAAREQLKNITDNAYILENTIRLLRTENADREKAAPQDVESLSSKFHDIYMQEAKRQGDVRHKDAYADLSENIKEFDRVLARYVLGREKAAIAAARLEEAELWRKQGAFVHSWNWAKERLTELRGSVADRPESPNGNPPSPERGARTEG